MEVLLESVESIPTSSPTDRLKIFKNILKLLNAELSLNGASQLVDIIFMTLIPHNDDLPEEILHYDDLLSREAVDDVILKGLAQPIFMVGFMDTLLLHMDEDPVVMSLPVCLRLLEWSCLLLSENNYTTLSVDMLMRVLRSQASILQVVATRKSSSTRSIKPTFNSLFSKSPQLYKLYVDGLRNLRILRNDIAPIISLLLDFSINDNSFSQYKAVFLKVYVDVVLNAKQKPSLRLNEAFQPLLLRMSDEDLKNVITPISLKLLSENREIVLESFCFLLRSVNLDLSKYARDVLLKVLPQVLNPGEEKKHIAPIIRYLSQKSRNPDSLIAMFSLIKAMTEELARQDYFVPSKLLMITDALQALSATRDENSLSNIAPTISNFLVSCYNNDENNEVKLAVLLSLSFFAQKSSEIVQPSVLTFISKGLGKDKTLRREHLRCVRVFTKNADVCLRISSLIGSLIELVKVSYTNEAERVDGIYALLAAAKIAAVDIKKQKVLSKKVNWSGIVENKSYIVQLSLVTTLSAEDCLACVDLFEVLLVDHFPRVQETVSAVLQSILYVMCHLSQDVRKDAFDAVKRIIVACPNLSENLLIEFSSFLSLLIPHESTTWDGDILPSRDVLVEILLEISSLAFPSSLSACMILLCSHHPSIVSGGRDELEWMLVKNHMERNSLDVSGFVVFDGFNVVKMCEDLLKAPTDSSAKDDVEVAINTLATLMSWKSEQAKEIRHELGDDCSGLVSTLSHRCVHVRAAAAKAVTRMLTQNSELRNVMLAKLLSLYEHSNNAIERHGVSLALSLSVDLYSDEYTPLLVKYLLDLASDARGGEGGVYIHNEMKNLTISLIERYVGESMDLFTLLAHRHSTEYARAHAIALDLLHALMTKVGPGGVGRAQLVMDSLVDVSFDRTCSSSLREWALSCISAYLIGSHDSSISAFSGVGSDHQDPKDEVVSQSCFCSYPTLLVFLSCLAHYLTIFSTHHFLKLNLAVFIFAVSMFNHSYHIPLPLEIAEKSVSSTHLLFSYIETWQPPHLPLLERASWWMLTLGMLISHLVLFWPVFLCVWRVVRKKPKDPLTQALLGS